MWEYHDIQVGVLQGQTWKTEGQVPGQQIISLRFVYKEMNRISTVSSYVKDRFNHDWSYVLVDIIDIIDMNEDLTHLIKQPLNIHVYNDYTN